MSTDVTVKIAGKQGASGITDDLAEKLHNGSTTNLIAVVELTVAERRERVSDGHETVILTIGNLEPAVDQLGTDHLRDFQRALWANRRRASEDQELPIENREDVEPTVEEVARANPGVIHHDYMATTTGECEVCGRPESYSLHKAPPADPFTVIQGGSGDDEEGDEELPDPDDADATS